MILLFIIISVVLSVLTFFIKHKIVNIISTVLFSVNLISLSFYAYLHIDKQDSIYYKFDALGVIMTFVITIISIAAFYHSYIYLKRKANSESQKASYYAFLFMFITAMLSAYFTENFAVLWVSIEATSLFVSLLIFHSRTKDAIEATWKYLFVSSVGLAIAFIGILFLSIIATDSGVNNLNISNLLLVSHNMDIVWLRIAFILILTGFSVKISLFPLYTVAIDAKTIVASPINALMSTALVNVGFVGIYRIFTIIANTESLHWAQHIFMIVGIISIFITAIQLTRVKRFKRLLAFSSMEHMGLVFIGIAVGGIGYYAAILHIIFHSFIKAGLFFQLGSIRSFYKSIWIKDTGMYFKLNPIGALVLIIGLVSILAIPPSGMFVSEFMIFKAMFINGNYWEAIITLILLSFIIYIIAKQTFHLLFSDIENSMLNNKALANRYEPLSQFVLFSLVIYLGINPPVFFTDLINASIAILN